MKEILVRSLSGILYVALLVTAIFLSKTAFILLFAAMGLGVIGEFVRLFHFSNRTRFIPYLLFVLLLGLFHFYAEHRLLSTLWLPVAGINLLWVVGLFVDIPFLEQGRLRKPLAVAYLLGGLLLTTGIPFYGGAYDPLPIAAVFVLVWMSDIFAYLAGKNFGRHKLLERVSPKKTVEGFFGGFLAACIAGIVIFILTQAHHPVFWLGLAVVVCVFGALGDLVQSKFKRRAGVKDSGRLMPGHGGLYDRLDSIIFAAPFLYGYLLLSVG